MKSFLHILNILNFLFIPWDWIIKNPSNGMILRHDVDRNPKQSLRIAEISSELGIAGTFNFRVLNNRIHEEIVVKITELGHEIGYHYEDLSIANGDMKLAIELFDKNLQMLRQFSDVKTATMHGRPLSKFDNRDIWKFTKVENFDLIGESYVSIDYTNLFYLTDTGRTWSETKANLRDSALNSIALPKSLGSTEDIKNLIDVNDNISIAIVFHPERWSSNHFQLFLQIILDFLSSTIKKMLRIFRKLS